MSEPGAITIQFEGDRFSGTGGCNRHSGSLRRKDNGVETGPLATTQMMCGDEVIEVEREYLATLAGVSAISMENGTMPIEPAAGTRRFCAEPEGVMEQERRYLEVLTEFVTFAFRSDGVLEMFDAAGARLLQFRRLGMAQPARR